MLDEFSMGNEHKLLLVFVLRMMIFANQKQGQRQEKECIKKKFLLIISNKCLTLKQLFSFFSSKKAFKSSLKPVWLRHLIMKIKQRLFWGEDLFENQYNVFY